jgi:hypothetical protein
MSASAFYLLPFWRWQQQAVLRPPAWAASRATASAAAPRIEVPFLEMKSVIQSSQNREQSLYSKAGSTRVRKSINEQYLPARGDPVLAQSNPARSNDLLSFLAKATQK